MGTKLYVGNLNYNTTDQALREVFGGNGREVASVTIIIDSETGRPRGFAFVDMTTSDFAQQALRELEGHMVDGRPLRISEAREREPRGAGGPGAGPRSYSGGPPRSGGYGGGGGYAGGGGFGGGGGGYAGGGGAPPSGGFGGGAGAPPQRNFGPNSPPGGADARRKRNDRGREVEGASGGKRGRRGGGNDDGEW